VEPYEPPAILPSSPPAPAPRHAFARARRIFWAASSFAATGPCCSRQCPARTCASCARSLPRRRRFCKQESHGSQATSQSATLCSRPPRVLARTAPLTPPPPTRRAPTHTSPRHPRRFYDARFAASGEGREVVRTASTGVVRVALNAVTRGMAAHGYAGGAPPDANDLNAETAGMTATGTVGTARDAGSAAAASSLPPLPPSSSASASAAGGSALPAASRRLVGAAASVAFSSAASASGAGAPPRPSVPEVDGGVAPGGEARVRSESSSRRRERRSRGSDVGEEPLARRENVPVDDGKADA
jgi:hypothetical protein